MKRDNVEVVVEYYRRPPSTISRFVTLMLEKTYGQNIRFFKLVRYASILVIQKGEIKLLGNIYVGRKGFYILGIGNWNYLDKIQEKIPIDYILCKNPYCPGEAKESRKWVKLPAKREKW